MIYNKTLPLLLAAMLKLDITHAFTTTTYNVNHPKVGNWEEATNGDGLVRIPLRNPKGFNWFASLQMGTPLQREQMCVISNNHNLNAVFAKECKNCPHSKFNAENSETAKVDNKETKVV